ncbi:hypothetical protein D0Z70_22085 [Sphingobium terrigena]|uniref:Uncharacterized protein n=1 Tax=Sphingobium terrigena TaxID=2304063 RepID=A0A418YLN5_9SPHN|nr:hypothetical protein [Sphingobium terrigena]RJG52015.1 hypothetical protein D0Z70_22085 [Sphingobium terrigena]
MSSFMGIGLSAGIGAGFIAAGLAWRRCGTALCLAIGIFFMPQHPGLSFAMGGIAAGILSSCIGMPAMPGIASCFSIMPPAGIDPFAGGAGWVEVWPAACPWADAMAGDSKIELARASARKREEGVMNMIDTPL